MKSSKKHFHLLKASSGSYSLVCFSLDSTRPDSYIEALEKELSSKSWEGNILMDLLASNGETSRRFITIHFDGAHLNWNGAVVTPRASLAQSTLNFCQKFYDRHKSALSKSVLSPAARHRIKSQRIAEA